MRRGLALGGILLVVIGGVYAWQAVLAGGEKDALSSTLYDKQIQLEKGKAAAAGWELLEEDIRNYELELQRLARILPERLGVDEFLIQLNTLADEHQLELVEVEPRLLRNEFYDTADIALGIEGDPTAAAVVIERMQRSARLVGSEDLRASAQHTSVRLRIFSVADEATEPAFVPCALPTSRVWLPGLRGTVTRLRAELETVCRDVEVLAEQVERVQRLEQLRETLEVRIAVIDQLARSENRPPARDEDIEAFEQLIAEAVAAGASEPE